MRNKGGHGLKARVSINDIPQCDIDILNRSTYTVEIKDTATGKIESRVTRPMRSFTANFLRLMWGRMTGAACTGGLDINDTAIDESSGKATNLKCVGATTGLKKFGIAIGSGTGAVAQTDNKLTWDTGFTTYGATTLKTATVISGSDIYFEIQKAFTNNTGSSRTIYEAGLCTTGEGTEADNNTNVLIAREITNGATGTAVATGKVLTVVFKISSTFTTDGTINFNFMKILESAFLCDLASTTAKLAVDPIPFGKQAQGISLWYKGKMWYIGGILSGTYNDAVYSSDDGGVTWDTVSASCGIGARAGAAGWVYGGKMWVGGGGTGTGYLNDVWWSTDGASWTRATASAAWSARSDMAFEVYDGKMWLAGGDVSSAKNDVYYSTDGASWTQATASAGWAACYGCKMAVFLNRLYIYGGVGGGTYYDTVYYSTNGSSWTSASAGATGAGRYQCALFAINDRLYIYGGAESGNTPSDDLYVSTDGASFSSISTASTGQVRMHLRHWKTDYGVYVGLGYISNSTWDTSTKLHWWPFSDFMLQTSATMPTEARIDAASGSVYGVTAGTGTGNFTGADTVLGTPIADGSGASQLDCGDMTDAGRLSEPTVTGADNIMRLERDFANNSGGSITLKEVGLSAKGLDALGLMEFRAKVDKAVADGASVRVAIELVTTV